MIGMSALLTLVGSLPVDHAMSAAITLGQTTGGGGQRSQTPVSLQQGLDILVGLGWLLAAVAILIVAAVVLRKWLLRDDTASNSVQFTMADLREMRDQGLMSPEEFDRAKKFLVSRGKALIQEEEDPLIAKARARRASASGLSENDQNDDQTDDQADDDGEGEDDRQSPPKSPGDGSETKNDPPA